MPAILLWVNSREAGSRYCIVGQLMACTLIPRRYVRDPFGKLITFCNISEMCVP
jgi:hypothetical protein